MSELVSVIVPVYNCQPYIEACIQSVLEQTYDNIELLLIDDGSTDDSGKICDAYAGKPGVRVFHKKNQGVSATRNVGISLCQGEYVLFLDSDDTIEPDMIYSMVVDLEMAQADCAFCGLFHDYPSHTRVFPEKPAFFTTDGSGAVKEVLINYQATAGPVCKLFRKKLLAPDIFPTDLTIGEDAVAVCSALFKAKTTVFHTKPYYHYNHRENSLMSSDFSQKDLDLIKAYSKIAGALATSMKKEAEFRLIWAHFHVYDKMIRDPEVWKADRDPGVVDWLRDHILNILINPYVGRKRKLAAIALFFNRKLYRSLVLKS